MPDITTSLNTTVRETVTETADNITVPSTVVSNESMMTEQTVISQETAGTSIAVTEITNPNGSLTQETLVSESSDISSDTSLESITAAPIVSSVTTNNSEYTVTTVVSTEHEVETEISAETVLSEETTAETTAISTVVTDAPQETTDNSNKSNYSKAGTAVLLLALIAAFIVSTRKKSAKKADSNDARQRDEERLAKSKPKKKQSNKKVATEKQNKNKSALSTLPYIKVMNNDIWLIAPNTYSKAYKFADINYNIGDVPQQLEILQNYSAYLNTLDDTIDCQICCWNCGINVEDFERDILIDYTGDEFDKYREEFNERVLKANLSKGNNSIQKQLFLTITIKTPDYQYAVQKFKMLDLDIHNNFERIGNTHLHPMTSQQRVELLKDFFVGVEVDIPVFSEDDFKKKLEKVYCAPDYFEFKSDYFMFNDKYAKCIFIKDYPSKAADSIITDLMATNLQIMVTTNIIAHEPAKARKLVQRQITAIDTNMAQRESKAAQHGNFSNQMPQRIKNQRDGYLKLFDKLTIDDQKLFSVNTIILITAKSFDELQSCEDIIASTLKRNGCMYGQMKYQQEDGMIDCLPVGSQRKFEFRRSMPTESVAIFQPWNVLEVTFRNATYYGLNSLSNNMITFNRMTGLNNPSGFFLGGPGSGKSFTSKKEMADVFLRMPDADIVIIDPEREYHDVVDMFKGEYVTISLGSKNYINIFDFEFALLDDPEVNVISDKCQLIASFVSCMDKAKALNAQEISFLDRCIAKTYANSGVLETRNKADMPTLADFYEVIINEQDVDEAMKKKISITIEMYVSGSAKYYNNTTNVDVNNRVICYDIKDLSDSLKTQTMLLVLDYIWSRLSANREKGRSTWIYIDEIYLLFSDPYCLEYLRRLYKRARKYGGVLTGITQNVEDLLKNDSCSTMLSNSEFIVLLKQAPADIIKLREVLKFNDSEIECITNVKPGQGLLVLGGKDKIPFYDDFPKDTDMYRRFTTSFTELAELKKQQTK